jgi:hypothetical protein
VCLYLWAYQQIFEQVSHFLSGGLDAKPFGETIPKPRGGSGVTITECGQKGLSAGQGIGLHKACGVIRNFSPDVHLIRNQHQFIASQGLDNGNAEIFLMGWKDKSLASVERAPFGISFEHS